MTAPSIDQWEPGVMTFHGQVLEYDGRCYRAKYAHLTMSTAPPPTDPTMWDEINPLATQARGFHMQGEHTWQ